MRVIHTSDWHLGRRLYDQDLLEHSAQFLRWLLDQAIEHEVAAVVVAGDVYDRAVPSTDAVALLDRTLVEFARAAVPVLLTAGNHDSAVRLGFGRELSEATGIHLRTDVADLDRPLLLRDDTGEVGIYGIPYLHPDAVMRELDTERSHRAVLTAATDRIRADAARRGLSRTVVAAHAFVTGASPSDSERDIRVGGIGDVGAEVFAGLGYVALGHLHRRQLVRSPAGATVVYSGSPLPFSFTERADTKSVELVEFSADGTLTHRPLAAPAPRTLREVTGRLADLVTQGAGESEAQRQDWIRAVLTDPTRPAAPLESLRAVWPNTLALDFAPAGGLIDPVVDLARLGSLTDPVDICAEFVAYVDAEPADDAVRDVLRRSVETAQAAT